MIRKMFLFSFGLILYAQTSCMHVIGHITKKPQKSLSARYSTGPGYGRIILNSDESDGVEYAPTRVLMHSKNESETRTIYHKTNVEEVILPKDAELPDESDCSLISRMLYEKKFNYPVVICHKQNSYLPVTYHTNPANNTAFVRFDKKQKELNSTYLKFLLGHELGHFVFYANLNDEQKDAWSKSDLLYNNYVDRLPRKDLENITQFMRTEELICDQSAAELLGSTIDEKIEIATAGINLLHGLALLTPDFDNNSDLAISPYPSYKERIEMLQQQLAYYQQLKNQE